MTRSYDVVVLIQNHEPDRECMIKRAVEDQWDIEHPVEAWSDLGDGVLEAFGSCSLYAGDRPADFAARLAESVWRANSGYCDVGLVAVKPGLWAEKTLTYRTTRDDYTAWAVTDDLPYLGDSLRDAAPLARAA